MTKRAVILFFLALLFIMQNAYTQSNIHIANSSFENANIKGELNNWYDCSALYFKDESPPTHVNSVFSNPDVFEIRTLPIDGAAALNLVTRETKTWEMLQVRLSEPLQANVCYEFSLNVCTDKGLKSSTKNQVEKSEFSSPVLFNNPVSLYIIGSNVGCDRITTLAKTPPIEHGEWKQYTFQFTPSESYSHLVLEAFYADSSLISNGNIMLDNLSTIAPAKNCTNDLRIKRIGLEDIIAKVNANLHIFNPHNTKKNTKFAFFCEKNDLTTFANICALLRSNKQYALHISTPQKNLVGKLNLTVSAYLQGWGLSTRFCTIDSEPAKEAVWSQMQGETSISLVPLKKE